MKNRGKKWLALWLAVLMLVGIAPFSAAAESYGVLTYEVDNGEVTITGCDESVSGAVEIPATIDGYPVTSIDDYAFSSLAGLTRVTIPASVTRIGECAFFFSWTEGLSSLIAISVDENNPNFSSDAFGVLYNKDKTELIQYPIGNSRTAFTIPDSVTSIGDGAFSFCTGLTSVTIPNSVTSIGNWAFSRTGLTSVTIPNSVTSIGEYAFEFCNMTSVTIPDGVISIGQGAFSDCENLVRFTIPKSVTSIGHRILTQCPNLSMITVDENNPAYCNDENGVLYSKDKSVLLQYTIGNPRLSFTIPEGVTKIEEGAFEFSTNLESVVIPNSVTTIENSAFSLCFALANVVIGNSVTSIGAFSFGDCTSLKSVTIPASVTSIGYWAFRGCTGLTSVTIPDSVTAIEERAFSDCKSLESITIPGSITTLNDYSFCNCESLASVVIGHGVTSIGWAAFGSCTSLTSIHIPSSVTEIRSLSFSDCENLEYICSDTADCYARTYAEENGIAFRVCDGKHPQPIPNSANSADGVSAECDGGAYDGAVYLLAEKLEKSAQNWENYEFILDPRTGQEEMKAVYLIRTVDENGDPVQPKPGCKVTVKVPVPAGCDYKKCRVCHVVDEASQRTESFKWNPAPGSAAKSFTISSDGRYFIFEVSSFSPFIVVEGAPSVISVSVGDVTVNAKSSVALNPDVVAEEGARYTVSYSSSNPDVATVDANGSVTGVDRGKATITCTVTDEAGNSVSGSCTVTVKLTVWQWARRILLIVLEWTLKLLSPIANL